MIVSFITTQFLFFTHSLFGPIGAPVQPATCFDLVDLPKIVACFDNFHCARKLLRCVDVRRRTAYSDSTRSLERKPFGIFSTQNGTCPSVPEAFTAVLWLSSTFRNTYCVLYETTLSSNCTASRCHPYSKGWGLFIVPVRQSHIFRDLHFSAPHPTVRHGHSSTSCSSIPALPCEEPPCCRTSSTCLQQTIDLRSITSAFALLHNRSSARYRMRQLIVTLTDFDLSFVPDGAVFSTRVLSYAIGQT